MTGTDTPPSSIDAARLIAEIRRNDPVAIKQAYQLTFGNPLGRLVLAHHLASCGVGMLLGRQDLDYVAGRHDAAIDLANMAGFDQAALAAAVLTDNLEERSDDPSSHFDASHVPSFDDDDFT